MDMDHIPCPPKLIYLDDGDNVGVVVEGHQLGISTVPTDSIVTNHPVASVNELTFNPCKGKFLRRKSPVFQSVG